MKVFKIIIVMLISILLSSGVAIASSDNLRVAIVTESQLGDKAWCDAAHEGFKKINEELEVKAVWIECKGDKTSAYKKLIYAAENNDIVFLVTGRFFMEMVPKVAPNFPDVSFITIDCELPLEDPNVHAQVFLQNEATFLAGACAAMMTSMTNINGINSEKIIGFVGGFDVPIIHDFLIGYKDGAKYIDPEIEIKQIFVGTHFDPTKGKEAAAALHSAGADIIFHAAGLTGMGVLEAANEGGYFAIGVDSPQEYLYPGHVITSALKGWENTIYLITEEAINAKLAEKTYVLGLANNGVGLSYSKYALDLMPASVYLRLQEIEKDIINGKIKPESLYKPGEHRY